MGAFRSLMTGYLSGEVPGLLTVPDKMNLRKAASAHVRPVFLGSAPFAFHFQLRISGMSSPYCRM